MPRPTTTRQHADVPFGRLPYRDSGPSAAGPGGGPGAGDEPAVVFVHGVLVDGRLWDGVADALPETVRTVQPDLPLGAHTAAVARREHCTPDGMVDAAVALLDHLGIERAVLVGNDTGGGLSQLVAARHPDRVAGLVLTSCDAFDQFPPTLLKPVITMARWPASLVSVAWMFGPAMQRWPLPLSWLVKHGIDGDLMRAWLRPLRTDAAVRADFGHFLRGLARPLLVEAEPALRAYEGPVRLAWSADELIFSEKLARRLAAVFPDAELTFIPDARTFSPLDAPGAVAAAVTETLARVAARR